MTQNPYASPAELPPLGNGRASLIPVAISLVVVSVLWIFLALSGISFFYFSATAPDAKPEGVHTFKMYSAWLLISIGYSLVLITGALSMVRRGSYVWAVATSWLALVPLLGPCYFLAIPIGIWALIVLRRPSVRDSFKKP